MEEKSAHAPRINGFSAAVNRCARGPLDLNALLARNPSATFFARMSGDSMAGEGIFDGDLLVIDRSLAPADGDIVVAYAGGEFVARRFRRVAGGARLEPWEGRGGGLAFPDESGIDLFGVVTASIRRFSRK